MTVEILDTTLRDGEQTSGVSFSTVEKMAITRLLLNELNVPRVEVASARESLIPLFSLLLRLFSIFQPESRFWRL